RGAGARSSRASDRAYVLAVAVEDRERAGGDERRGARREDPPDLALSGPRVHAGAAAARAGAPVQGGARAQSARTSRSATQRQALGDHARPAAGGDVAQGES